MARLMSPAPKLPYSAASTSKTAKPAPRFISSRGAPTQTAISAIKASAVRPSPDLPVPPRTRLGAVSAAVQHARSARNAPASTSTTSSGAYTRVLRVNTVIHNKIARIEQKKYKHTRIPKPTPTVDNISKWTNTRQHVLLIKKETRNKKSGNGAMVDGTSSPEHKVATLTKYYENMDVSEITSEGCDTLFENDNSEVLNDVSFDDLIDGHIQSSAPSQLAKWQVLMDTVKQGGQMATRPKYFGDALGIRRKRPKYPWIKLDLSKPFAPSKIPRLAKPKAESEVLEVPIQVPTTLVKQSQATKSYRTQPVKTAARASYSLKPISDHKSIRKPIPCPKVYTTRPVKTASTCLTSVNRSSATSDSRPDSAVDVTGATEELSIPAPAPARKNVRFTEDLALPVLYNIEAPPVNTCQPLDPDDGWAPLDLGTTYGGSCEATGFDSMFESIGLDTITVKRRTLHRFKAVQDYEKRRKQAAGGNSDLGQLEYGNADYKLSLQLRRVVSAHHVGVFKDLQDLGIACNALVGPLLHFGGFRDEYGRHFQNVNIPTKAIAPYKRPVQWGRVLSVPTQLDAWTKSKFSIMQTADLAT